jgi:uncharacterized protein YecT (DUF1311 family)
MPTDRSEEPWSETTYRGLSGPGSRGHDDRPRRGFALPRITKGGLIVGAAAAVALGLALGLWARPNLETSRGADAAQRVAAAVPIEVNRPPPEAVTSNGKLEVLPPDVAAASRQASAERQSSLSSVFDLAPPPPLPRPAEPRAPTPPRVAALTPPPPLQAAPETAPSPPQVRAGLDCADAGSLAEEMICSDPDIAAADREMSRAYRRALRAGTPAGALRADQRDWLAIREDAARHSRRALAQVYQQRIDELNDAADELARPDDRY